MKRLPRPYVYPTECFDGTAFGRNHRDAHTIFCPGCGREEFVSCNSTRGEVMDLARGHFERCRKLFELRCEMVPQMPNFASVVR